MNFSLSLILQIAAYCARGLEVVLHTHNCTNWCVATVMVLSSVTRILIQEGHGVRQGVCPGLVFLHFMKSGKNHINFDINIIHWKSELTIGIQQHKTACGTAF